MQSCHTNIRDQRLKMAQSESSNDIALQSTFCSPTHSFELPPSTHAAPLPVRRKAPEDNSKVSRRKRKREELGYTQYGEDDTPKAFARMMQVEKGRKQRNGLDDGHPQTTKKSKFNLHTPFRADALPATDVPKILPHERLSDFSSRVNQAIPVAGLERRGKGLGDAKAHQTKKEKRMQNMYADWRRQDTAHRRKEEEAREIAEEEQEELEASMEASLGYRFDYSKKRKRNRSRRGDEEGDPWARLKETRDQPRGLHDIVQAPPNFNTVPKEKFKVKNGAQVYVNNVPNSAGSLRRREELGKERNGIIEQYRKRLNSRGTL